MYLALCFYPSTVRFQDGLYLSHVQKINKTWNYNYKTCVVLHLVKESLNERYVFTLRVTLAT